MRIFSIFFGNKLQYHLSLPQKQATIENRILHSPKNGQSLPLNTEYNLTFFIFCGIMLAIGILNNKREQFMNQELAVGIDFGTSNSLVAVARDQDTIQPVELAAKDPVVPTALFFEKDGPVRYGKEAISSYLSGVPGRFMREIKTLLGSKTETEGTVVNGRFLSFADLIKMFVCFLKLQAEQKVKQPLDNIVMGRPVHFNDNPDEDKAAEKALRSICHQAGFKNIGFQYEPIAASLHYERNIQAEELSLVADLGGGTSDFSVIRLSPNSHHKVDRSSDVLANDSIHLAGTDLDYNFAYDIVMPHFGKEGHQKNGLPIPYFYYFTACTWHEIRKMYTPSYLADCQSMLMRVQHPELFGRYVSMVKKGKGHHVLFETEDSKIRLSQQEKSELDLTEIEPDFYIPVTKEEFLKSTREVRQRIVLKAYETLKMSGAKPDDIKNIIFTGGTSLVPAISEKIRGLCPKAQVQKISTFSAVGEGLALDAAHRYGINRAPLRKQTER